MTDFCRDGQRVRKASQARRISYLTGNSLDMITKILRSAVNAGGDACARVATVTYKIPALASKAAASSRAGARRWANTCRRDAFAPATFYRLRATLRYQ